MHTHTDSTVSLPKARVKTTPSESFYDTLYYGIYTNPDILPRRG